jgi:hypothetical protein
MPSRYGASSVGAKRGKWGHVPEARWYLVPLGVSRVESDG